MILESVENGPLIWPSIEENGVTRLKKYSKLSPTEAIQVDCDVKATNIILQGLPPEVYALYSRKGMIPIDAINHMMSFLNAVVTSRYPTTNNQLRNSPNPTQQATINNGRVMLQPIQGRQTSVAASTSRTYTPGAKVRYYLGITITDNVNNDMTKFQVVAAISNDLFSTFNQQLVDELVEVQNVFYQMEQAVEQHRIESKTFEVKMNKALNENERLLEQVMSKDIVNLIVNSSMDFASVNVHECEKCLKLKTELQKDFVEKRFTINCSKVYTVKTNCIVKKLILT
ncbi:hypothetical protein Tco_1301408 [Tanacetum coccineum]